jgi:hypothetical protein
VRLVYTSTTPAASASSSRNASNFSVQPSLLYLLLVVMAVNAAANWGVDVCAFHCAALFPYSLRQAPSTHRYDVLFYTCTFVLFTLGLLSSAGGIVLGWPTLSAPGGPAEADVGEVASMVGSPADRGVRAIGVIGMVVYSKSWSVKLWGCKLV